MIAVIFEVIPKAGRADDYFRSAADLASTLKTMPGFVSIERFESLSESGKFLSLSFWRNEESVADWRNLASHRAAQSDGRERLFQDYRIRVASVVRDYGMTDRGEAPADSRALHVKGR